MAAWVSVAADQLWRNAFAVIPLALLVAGLSRWLPARPATRHTLWLIVLLWFFVPALLPVLPGADIFEQQTAESAGLTAAEAPAPVVLPAVHATRDLGKSVAPFGNVSRRETAWRSLVHPETRVAFGRQSDASPSHRVHALPKRPVRIGPLLPATPKRAVASPERRIPGGLRPESPSAGPLSSCFVSLSTSELESPTAEAMDDPIEWGTGLLTGRSDTESPAVPDGRRAADAVGEDPATAITETPSIDGRRVWAAWLASLIAVRDTIAGLPAIPLDFWLAGILVVLLARAACILRFERRLRSAVPAPASVRRMVADLSRRYGLKQMPETVMVNATVSPMIWCGRRTRLVLPAPLWSQLDSAGRRAVLCHELAHLRRRDHWVCWLGLIVSGLFWWHPVVWWARRRLHDEAELCCDAWVTWLNPRSRRAYAEALLRTKQYVDEHPATVPSVGIGVSSVRGRWFSRRLTMVMTRSERPRASVAGIALMFSLAAAGWLTTPAWSSPCDTQKKAKSKSRGETTTLFVPATPVAQRTTTIFSVPTPPRPDDGSFQTYVSRGAPALFTATPQEPPTPQYAVFPNAAAAPQAPLYTWFATQERGDDDDELAARIKRIEKELKKLSADLKKRDKASAPRRAERRPRPDRATRGTPRGGASGGGDTIIRTYQLPKGKLEALSNLMVRQDVPVLVSPKKDGIEVHGTEAQHRIFKAFVDMIHPKKGDKASRASGGRAGGLDSWRDALKAYTGARAGQRQTYSDQARQALDQARQNQEAVLLQGRYRDALRQALDFSEQAQSQQLSAFAAAIEGEAKALEAQAEAFEVQAEALNQQAEEIARHAESVDEPQEAQALEHAAKALERQARQLERQARSVEKKMNALEKRAKKLETEAKESKSKRKARRGVRSDAAPQAAREFAELARTDASRLISEALLAASSALRKEAKPAVREALREAAAALRTKAKPAATDAIREAARALREQSPHPAAAKMLERAAEALEHDAPPVVARILEKVAKALEDDAPEAAIEILEKVADALEAEAKARKKSESR